MSQIPTTFLDQKYDDLYRAISTYKHELGKRLERQKDEMEEEKDWELTKRNWKIEDLEEERRVLEVKLKELGRRVTTRDKIGVILVLIMAGLLLDLPKLGRRIL
jgi:t-SNARE complex subunit (syntaxin)